MTTASVTRKGSIVATHPSTWGDRIATAEIGGIRYQMYVHRPRRVEELLAFADRWGVRPHVIQAERVVTFQDLRRMVAAKAEELVEIGANRGDRVFILGWNSPEWIANFWACLQIGAVPVLANAWWSQQELAEALAALRPAITLADDHCASKMPRTWRCGAWVADLSRVSDRKRDVSAISTAEEEPAVVIFTSGTEGRPKAVVLPHRALLAGLQMLLHITRRLPNQLVGSGEDIALHTGPLFHVGGVQTLLRAITVGSTLVMPRGKYAPAEALELIERYKIGRWAAVPTMVSRLLEHPDVHRRDLASLKSITVGGAPVHAELMRRIRTGIPSVEARIPTGYGLTENGGQATAASGNQTAESPGSSGRPLPCVEIRFEPRPGFPDGEILLRSPTQMSGYFGLNQSPIDADGWLHTGDLGRVDDKGNLWITGRCKDMIIRGGENIAPVAVERALMTIPGVSEAVVFGVPHADLGEEVMAIVVIDRELTPQQLQDQLRSKVASFAVPTRWKLQKDSLPSNHTGKVDKVGLIAHARLEIAEEAARVLGLISQ